MVAHKVSKNGVLQFDALEQTLEKLIKAEYMAMHQDVIT